MPLTWLLAASFALAGESPCFTPYCQTAPDPCGGNPVLSWDAPEPAAVPDVLLRTFTPVAAAARIAALGGEVVGGIPQIGWLKVRGLPLDAVASFGDAQPNGTFRGAGLPTDAHFGDQWQLQNTGQPWPYDGSPGTPGADINAPPAWDIEQGDPAIVVAVLDSGVDYCHPEFAGRLLRGYDFVDDDDVASIIDCFGNHGLYVTGLLGAAIDNANGQGVVGVAPGITILPVRVWKNPGVPHPGQDFDLAEALCWVADDPCVRVVNLSLAKYPWEGGGAVIEDALAYAAAAGKILVAASGNNDLPPPDGTGPGSADLSLLAASPHTIAVGSLDHRNKRSPPSGTGASLDFVAHGDWAVTVSPKTPGGGYPTTPTAFAGTSAAAPQVSGLVALILSRDPSLGPSRVYRLLKLSADDEVHADDAPGWDPAYGWGRIDCAAALGMMP